MRPAAVINVLATIENPMAALSRADHANGLFAAFNSEFGFIRRSSAGGEPIQAAELSKLTSLLRWVIQEMKMWRQAGDPLDRKLVAIFVVAQASDPNDELWGLLSLDIGENTELVQRLKKLVASLSASVTTRGDGLEPIWEREAAEKFAIADAAGDWVAIRQGLRLFEHQLLPIALVVQSIRCLHRCGMDHLVEAVTNLRQTVVAMHVAAALSVKERLGLAVASNNPYVQFSCVCQMLSSVHSLREQLLPDEQMLLTATLLNVAADEPRWNAWMQTFNSHPVQNAALQTALGRALADASEAAVEA
jgi:hypothetical protein